MKIFSFKTIFFACIYLLNLGVIHSQQHENKSYIKITDKNEKIDIFSRLEFLEGNCDQEFDYESLRRKQFAIPEKPQYCIPEKLQSCNLKPDGSIEKSQTIWMRCTLKNQTQEDLQYYYILRHAYLNKGTVFLISKNAVVDTLHTYSYKDIDTNHRHGYFPTWQIPIPKNEEVQVYIKAYETGGRTRISSLLKERRHFIDYIIYSSGIHAAFILFVLIVVFITIHISQYTKRSYVLFYALYVLFLGVDYLATNGIGLSYIWTEVNFLVLSARSMSNAASAMFLGLFFTYFYDQYKYPFWVKKVFKIITIVFGIFLLLYGIKVFTGGFSLLFLFVWRTIEVFAVILVVIHSYLAFKRTIPLYLPLVFIIHTSITFYNSMYIFPYSENYILDWVILNIYYISLVIEVVVWTYFIFDRLKKEKVYLQELEIEVEQLQEKLDVLKSDQKKNSSLTNELIHLKSKAVLNSVDILYVKSDGHYVEYYVENKKTPEIDRNPLTEVLKQLPSSCFVRTHKSYIVNIYKIKIINSTKLMLDNGEWLNLSRTYKQQLKDILHPGE